MGLVVIAGVEREVDGRRGAVETRGGMAEAENPRQELRREAGFLQAHATELTGAEAGCSREVVDTGRSAGAFQKRESALDRSRRDS